MSNHPDTPRTSKLKLKIKETTVSKRVWQLRIPKSILKNWRILLPLGLISLKISRSLNYLKKGNSSFCMNKRNFKINLKLLKMVRLGSRKERMPWLDSLLRDSIMLLTTKDSLCREGTMQILRRWPISLVPRFLASMVENFPNSPTRKSLSSIGRSIMVIETLRSSLWPDTNKTWNTGLTMI